MAGCPRPAVNIGRRYQGPEGGPVDRAAPMQHHDSPLIRPSLIAALRFALSALLDFVGAERGAAMEAMVRGHFGDGLSSASWSLG